MEAYYASQRTSLLGTEVKSFLSSGKYLFSRTTSSFLIVNY